MPILIRKAVDADIDSIMHIFSLARQFMRATGNPHQWINGYPAQSFMLEEIASGHCYVVDNGKRIIATFCFISGPDPTYNIIEQGDWLSDSPYHVIHRLASDGSTRGIASMCFEWCSQHIPHLRVDTHADNRVMHHLLQQNGFHRCGIIYVSNGTPRIAYEKL